jgi:hypothetical protein
MADDTPIKDRIEKLEIEIDNIQIKLGGQILILNELLKDVGAVMTAKDDQLSLINRLQEDVKNLKSIVTNKWLEDAKRRGLNG